MPNALGQGEIRSRSMGPREILIQGLERLFGDNRAAREKAEALTGALEMVTPVGTVNAAYDLPGQIEEAIQRPGVQSGLAAALTGASLIPFANPLAKAAGMAAKDAGRSARIFAGPQARQADRGALARSEIALSQGVHPDTVWQETGWNPNVANQAVWEIDDQPANWLNPYVPARGAMSSRSYMLGEALDHPELLENYPGFKDVEVKISSNDQRHLGYQAVWDRGGGKAGRITIARDVAENPEEARSIILHELQHAVQDVEGFPRGGSPRRMSDLDNAGNPVVTSNDTSDARGGRSLELYNRLVGEVEARNVQARKDFDAAQRRNLAPQWTEDRKRDRQIILNGDYEPVSR